MAVIEIKDLHFSYGRRNPEILKGVSFSLERGEIGVLLGKNGAGKTTLFKNILGIEKPASGEILLDGASLLSMSSRERSKRIAYVPQQVSFGELTVFNTVLTGRLPYFILNPGKEDYDAVSHVLFEMGLEEVAGRPVGELSGGEQQKVAIARAVVGNPELVIFDEPSGNLDVANERLLIREAKDLARVRNIAVLFSVHDLNEAAELGDRFFFMKDGIIRFAGGDSLFNAGVLEDIFGVKSDTVRMNGRLLILPE